MAYEESVYIDGTLVYFEVDFCNEIQASVCYGPESGHIAVDISTGDKMLFYEDGFKTEFADSLPELLRSLQEELTTSYGLQGFPNDPSYIMGKLKNPPPQFKNMGPNGMTVEEYLEQERKKNR